jgi:5-methylcytosine-specific restriction endonuclease McrA
MTILKQQILQLKEQGLSYSKIQKELGCSKATISYYLGEGQQKKVRERTRALRKANPLLNKIGHFKSWPYRTRKGVYDKIRAFSCSDNGIKYSEKICDDFTYKELLEKFKGTCYLTGRPIDLYKTRQYQLDHVIPRSKGGSLTLDNCDFAVKEANFAKGDLTLEEFFQLCIDVVKHNKLKVD